MITFTNIGRLGRLGNQMFQFASTLGIGRRLNYDVKFIREIISNRAERDPNSYIGCKLLDCFEIPETLIIPMESIVGGIKFRYTESDFKYNKETESIQDCTDLFGYFQTAKYFQDHRVDVLSAFKFKNDIVERSKSFLEIKPNYVSLHVRRGDYVSSSQHHPPQEMEYYKKAMEEFAPGSIFCVFSDDISWCKDNFKGDRFIFIETMDAYVDLYLMSRFENHIIANSSFSWWGSWLSESKKTVAPSKWFGPMLPKETSDVYCDGWIVI